MILLFFNHQGALFHSPLELKITVNSIQSQKHLGICLPTVGSQTWVRSGWEFFRTSGESNPRPWRWIKSIGNQHVKCNERRTRPCHRAYYIRGATPFHSCMIVRSPKLVSSEDRTGARAPSASYCSTEGVAPLHTAPPVLVFSSFHSEREASTGCRQSRVSNSGLPDSEPTHYQLSYAALSELRRTLVRYAAP
jgi:hypothetical protein